LIGSLGVVAAGGDDGLNAPSLEEAPKHSFQLLPIVELVEKGAPESQEHAAFFPLPESTPTGGGAAVPRR
jgi:hypothetical protein